jgi:hypothetical protein
MNAAFVRLSRAVFRHALLAHVNAIATVGTVNAPRFANSRDAYIDVIVLVGDDVSAII